MKFKIKGKIIIFATLAAGAVAGSVPSVYSQSKGSSSNLSEIEKQKKEAEQEIKETKAELQTNEKKVNESLASLRKIEEDISVSQKEIETVMGQLATINGNIATLETSIAASEAELETLRGEYLKAVKKMRVARKQNSGLAFIFSSGNFNEARRRMRYMKEFSDWKERRSAEIGEVVSSLQEQHKQLNQAKNDATVALKREETARQKLASQKVEQEEVVKSLRANSDALRAKLAKRQAESKKLSSQISQLIAEQRAKEAREEAARKKAEEEKKLAEEKAAAEKKAAEEKQLAEAKTSEKPKEKKEKTSTKEKKETKKESSQSSTEYAEARKKQPRTSETSTPKATVSNSASGFEGMKGSLPKPVGGSFKIVSRFGVHPISPDLPDIMDENLGIDAHVGNGATAQAVYDGEVIKIYDRTNTPGFRNIIVLKHGDYITVYANLETLSVKSGQQVKQGQSLGTVGADFDEPDHGLIHFEVWKNQTHLDPESWIKM